MEFRILGALEITDGTADLTPTTPKLRQVLAMLLVRQNQLVQTAEFVDELWGEDPPPSALATLQTYIYKLRKLLGSNRVAGGEELLRTRPLGYQVQLPGRQLDLSRFDRLVDQARARMEASDYDQTSRLLTEALAVWRGPVLADVSRGNVLQAEATRIEERRLQALEIRLDADLTLGRHRELLGELKSLATAYPLHEGFQAKLMLALHGSGRRVEALEVYHRLCELLDAELGLEPSPELVRLHRSLLSPEPAGAAGGEPVTVADAPRRALPTPAQLPPGIADLTGRDAVVARIEQRILGAAGERSAGCVVAVTGGPGTGKTALAVHAAHQLGTHFPDGQLFVELRGSTRTPVVPADVLDQMIRALGVATDQIPPTLAERSQLLRTVTAGRRVLLVLDDAGGAEQVSALLPGAGGPAVLVTARGLTVPAADQVVLDRLERDDGVALLTKMIGAERVAADPAAAARIVELCGGLPLALRAVGTRLAVTWQWPLSWVAEYLAESPNRLRLLRTADLDVRASFDASLDRLGEPERSAFIMLGALPSREFTVDDAASLLGTDRDETAATLGALVDAYLLRPVHFQAPPARYAFDELIQLYVRERLEAALQRDPPVPTGRSEDGSSLPQGGLVLLGSGVGGLFRAHWVSGVRPTSRPARRVAGNSHVDRRRTG